MKPSLQLRASQHLALTPQLQQSIRLLQLSTLELNQELEQALADNPLLERLDDPLDSAARISASGALQPDRPADPALESGSRSDGEPTPAAEASSDDESPEWGTDLRMRSGPNDDDEDDPGVQQVAAHGRTLADHLLVQLAGVRCSEVDRGLVNLLIDNLNGDGFLEIDLEEFAGMLPPELEIESDQIHSALSLLQSFDPSGVGARNLSECLLLQLKALEREQHTLVSEGNDLRLAQAIARDHLELLAARDYVKLRRSLNCDDAALRQAQSLIRSLNPRPGSGFSIEEPRYIAPDVIVHRTRSGWEARLNPDVVPRLRINDLYAQILKRNRSTSGTALATQLQEARWLLKNVQQRFDTILRVSSAIVERQRAFFTHGEVAMRPLVLREIAEELGLHESTISRVTTQKFMMTPQGTFELKYFFGSHISTESGGAASSTAIRALIRQLVANENPRSPLSDNQLADLLGEQGFVVARRTVAKYREAAKILPGPQRKVL